MEPSPLSIDTPPEIERLQVEGWRRMSSAQKAAIVSGLTASVIELARAGVRHRHPEESEQAQRLRLATILLGADLAHKAFPDLLCAP